MGLLHSSHAYMFYPRVSILQPMYAMRCAESTVVYAARPQKIKKCTKPKEI